MKKALRHLYSLFFLIIFLILALGSEDESSNKSYTSSTKVYTPSTYKYSKTSLNVRTGPSTNDKVITTLKINEKVSTYDTIVNGFTIILNKNGTVQGWVHDSYLQTMPLTTEERQKGKTQEKKFQQELNSSKSTYHKENIRPHYSRTNEYVVKEEGLFAATSEANFDLMMNCFISGDKQAILKMVINGQLKYLRGNDVVFLVEAKFKYFIVRQEGSTELLYVISEQIKKQ